MTTIAVGRYETSSRCDGGVGYRVASRNADDLAHREFGFADNPTRLATVGVEESISILRRRLAERRETPLCV
jgi:hypothetical protein